MDGNVTDREEDEQGVTNDSSASTPVLTVWELVWGSILVLTYTQGVTGVLVLLNVSVESLALPPLLPAPQTREDQPRQIQPPILGPLIFEKEKSA